MSWWTQTKKPDMKKRLFIFVIWTILLLALLSIPLADNNLPRTGIFQYADKIAHFCLFAVTGFLAIVGTAFLSRLRYRLLFGLSFSLLLAAGTEFGQSFLSYRSADPYDFLANLAGMLFGLVLYTLFYCWRESL